MRKIIVTLLLILLLSPWVWAQTEPEPKSEFATFTLGDIVIFGDAETRPDIAIKDVFAEQDIKNLNVKTLGEALGYMPGMQLSTGRQDAPRVYMNGYNLRRILVLIDGVPYYEQTTGMLDLNQIPAAVISRIEVTKGAASALYGPNALGGVINVITKKGGAMPTVSAYAEISEYNTHNLGVALGSSYGKVNGWLSVDHRKTDGWRLSGDYSPKTGQINRGSGSGGGGGGGGGGGQQPFNAILEDGGLRDNSDMETTSVWTRFGVDVAPGSEYYLSFHYITKDGGIPSSVNSNTATYQASGINTTQFNRLKVKEEIEFDITGKQELFEGFSLLGKFFYHQHNEEQESYYPVYNGVSSQQSGNFGGGSGFWGGYNQDSSKYLDLYGDLGGVAHNKDTMIGGQVIADWQINDMHILRGSVQYREDNHKDKTVSWQKWTEYVSHTGSVGLEYQLNLFDNRLSIIPGISYDWFEVTKAKATNYNNNGVFRGWLHPDKGDVMDSWNPMIGVNFTLWDGTQFYGSAAHKTRFPILREISGNGQNITNANPDLKPEKAWNYTLGVQQHLLDNTFTLGLAGFYNRVSDWISNDQDWRLNGTTPYYLNVKNVDIYGFQFNAWYRPIEEVTLSFDYTYNDARDRSSGSPTNKVADVYKHKLGAGASVLFPFLDTAFTVKGIYVGERYRSVPTVRNPNTVAEKTSGYFTMDAGLNTALFSDTMEVYVVVKNIFDRDYEITSDFPGRGRSFVFGTRLNF